MPATETLSKRINFLGIRGDLEMLSDALLGGLIGSVGTVLVTKVLDIIQKRQEHKYSLQKSFFEKKLQVAESFVSMVHYVNSTINIIKLSLDEFNKYPTALAHDFFEHMFKGIGEALQKAQSYDISSINLYFDIDNSKEKQNKVIIENIVHSLYSLTILMNYLLIKPSDDDRAKSIEFIKGHIEGLSFLVGRLNENISNSISQIRQEMKKYDI